VPKVAISLDAGTGKEMEKALNESSDHASGAAFAELLVVISHVLRRTRRKDAIDAFLLDYRCYLTQRCSARSQEEDSSASGAHANGDVEGEGALRLGR
jgi:hypothetical protein